MLTRVHVGICRGFNGTNVKNIYLQRGVTTRITFSKEQAEEIIKKIEDARQELLGSSAQPHNKKSENSPCG